ncbi:hypothetical protein FJZ33_10945, partial [Candidatus Poribacteria bacterium]|nr:hypothetical protein [Candidatus Poribacteria bacterium]
KTNRLGWNIGLIYAVNTFGAVLGCFMAGFVFVRTMGVSGTIYLAFGVNFLIFLLTLLISRGNSPQPENGKNDLQNQDEEVYMELPEWSSRVAILVIGISGFCALAYEVLWARILTLFLGSTNYAFSTMLSAFLCGLALGSFILSRFIDKRKDLLTMLSLVQIGIGLCAVLLIPTFGKLYSLGSVFTKPSWWIFISSRFSLSFLVMLLPTMLMGATFPLVVKIYTGKSVGSLGRSVGNVYSVNTLGSILGAFLAGFLLIPHIGIQRTIIIMAFINTAVGVTVMILNIVYSKSGSPRNVLRVSALIISVIIILLASVLIDLGKPLTYYTAIFKGPGASNKLLLYKEDVDACVTVVEDFEGIRRIFVDANQAAEDSRWDLPSHSVIGHLPLLLHPNPKTALVVGFGMGVTSWSISRHGVQVDAIEISPGVIEANNFFTKINNNVLKDPLVKLYLDDGRNYVFATNKKYDMISTGIIHPLVSSNSAGFYTLDFYDLCKKALTENGVMCQWVPLHRLPEEHYKMIIRTFKKAFPHTTIWYKYTPDFCILIGTPEKLTIDYGNFARRMENHAVKTDLAIVNMSDPIGLLDSFMMDEDTVGAYVGDGPLHTDNRPR